MAWTEDRVEVLKKLWAEGHSASQIAGQLGGVTRNAVIGKVHRLGLSGRATPSRPLKRAPRYGRAKPAATLKAAQAKTQSVNAETGAEKSVARAIPKVTEKASLTNLAPMKLKGGEITSVLTLKETMCKWPIGDPSDADFGFCGRRSSSGPYCTEHSKLAFQPKRKKGEKAPPFTPRKRFVG